MKINDSETGMSNPSPLLPASVEFLGNSQSHGLLFFQHDVTGQRADSPLKLEQGAAAQGQVCILQVPTGMHRHLLPAEKLAKEVRNQQLWWHTVGTK